MQGELVALQNEALLANPLLDFDKLLLIQRGVRAPALGLPQNWQSNSSLKKTGYDDAIAVLSPVTRWEYTDLVHCHSRRLFHMNPDWC